MEFIVRELQEKDNNQQFIELQKKFLAQMDKYRKDFSNGTVISDTYDSDEEDPCLIVISDNQIIAYATLYYEEEYFDNMETILIIDIFVLEEYQRYGIGSLLLKKIKEYSQNRHINFLYASVIPGNLQAANFFLKIGFEKDGKESFVMNVNTTY